MRRCGCVNISRATERDCAAIEGQLDAQDRGPPTPLPQRLSDQIEARVQSLFARPVESEGGMFAGAETAERLRHIGAALSRMQQSGQLEKRLVSPDGGVGAHALRTDPITEVDIRVAAAPPNPRPRPRRATL